MLSEFQKKIVEFQKLVDSISYKDWRFHVKQAARDIMYLQVGFVDEGEYWTGRKWLLSEHMTKSEVVQTAFKAVMTAEEHETREKFLYKDKAIFGPHYDVDFLSDVVGMDVVDARSHA